jgi:hypothetical protein
MHFEAMNYCNKQLLAIRKFNSLNEWLRYSVLTIARVGGDGCDLYHHALLSLVYHEV